MTVGTALASAAFAVFVLLSAGTLVFGQEQIGTIVGVAGIFMSVYEVSRQREAKEAAPEEPAGPRPPFRFPTEQGLVGGLFGGVIAGLIITVVYYMVVRQYAAWMAANGFAVPTFWDLLTPILVGAALIGAVIGLLSLGMAEFFAHIGTPSSALIVNRLTGGILGGFIAGLITGPLGTLYYGLIQWPVLHPAQMLTGALPAAGILVFAILYFGRTQFSGVAWRGLAMAMIATVLVSGLAAVVLSAFEGEIVALLQRYIVQGGRAELLTGGLFYGAFVGTLLGAVIGLTLLIAPAPESAPERTAAA